MKKIFIFLMLFLFLFLIFGIYLLKSDYSNKFSKKIKDSTPVLVKKFLKETLFFIPYSKKKIANLEIELSDLKKKIIYLD